jgi:hypothetical protein
MKSFRDFLTELNVAASGGVFGSGPSLDGHGGAVGNSDFYAPGDTRIPKVIGMFRRPGMFAKQKKRNKLKNAIKGKSQGKQLGKRASKFTQF